MRWTGQLTLQTRNGAHLPVLASLHAHHDENGDRRYVSGIMRDLRPRLADEQRLRDSERRLAEAQRRAQLGGFDMDLATGTMVWSDELHRILRTDCETFEPRYDSFLALVHDEDRSGVEAAIATTGEYVGEFRVVRPDGGVRVQAASGILEQSGGRIWAESEPGSGATFVVTLPLDATAAPAVSTASGRHDLSN